MLSRLNIFLLLATSFLFSCNIAGEQVTAAEASAFAITLEKDAHRNRVGFISENIIVPAFLSGSVPGLVPDRFRAGFAGHWHVPADQG